MRKKVSLDGIWKFCPAFVELEANQRFMDEDFDPECDERYEGSRRDVGWIEPGFDDSGWLDIPVPDSWNKSIPELWSYEGFGWYRREIDIPSSWADKKVLFACESSNYETTVYVNGERAGVHEGGYTPFSIPIHDHLRFGETNQLAISVDNIPKPERCPGGEFGWWNYGGMFRSTSLLVTERTYIEDAVVVTRPGREIASVKVHIVVSGEENPATGLKIDAQLSHDGDTISRASKELGKTDEGEIDLELAVENPLLWSPEDPNLYDLSLHLARDSQSLDSVNLRVGIRSIEVEGDQILLNGSPILIKGLNRHPEYPETGHTEREEDLVKDLRIIKNLGANALRCHYPNSRRTYELCDEMGILFLCEIPFYQWGRPEVKADSPEALDSAKRQLVEMIKSFRNHPCVFMWSVSNETMTKPRRDTDRYRELAEMTVKGNIELVELARELDPTRPVVEVSNCWPGDAVLDRTDVSAVNLYIGSSTPHVDTLHELAEKMHSRFEELRREQPSKPILVAEFGSWAIRGLRTDYFPGEDYQAVLIEEYWEALLKEPGFAGGFIWCYQDSDVHRRFEWDYEFRIAYGLYDLQRRPKESASVVRSLWKEE